MRFDRKRRLEMKKKILKKHLRALEKKCDCLMLIVKFQSAKLDLLREERLKKEREKSLQCIK